MTIRMGDGPVANLPAGLDAYAGYVDDGGDGVTYPGILAKFPKAKHLSISVHGAEAECGDVEKGALAAWTGYTVGYCDISNAQALIARYGRPAKLWTAHYTVDAHICDQDCWPGLPAGFKADGTQWTDHGGVWDESLLADDFFDFQAPKGTDMADIAAFYDPDSHQQHVLRDRTDGAVDHWYYTHGGTGWVYEKLPAPPN